MKLLLVALCAALQLARTAAAPVKPNIVWFLTDDQDQMLGSSFPQHGGVGPMPKTKILMQDQGAMATNMFIHTPICCPSRSELLSGRYLHNIKQQHGGCMHVNESKVNGYTFAKDLKQDGGYTVGMFGKYLNNMPTKQNVGPGGQISAGTAVPYGFDAWLANGGGDYLGSPFNTQNISFGRYHLPDGVWRGTSDNYSTSVIGNMSIAWIQHVVKQDPTRPFFAYVAPKAAHEPFNPAPWYRTTWDERWPKAEPKNPSWNSSFESRADHHGNIATEDMLTHQAAVVMTDVFKNRWRTLMSVDDAIGGVIEACEKLGLAEHTYFFYSSDHGFQLGEMNIIMDKRQPYDWDTRIHLLARGPGIKPGSLLTQPITQVDMAPTFLGLAGLAKPKYMDGKSIAPLLMPAAFEDAAQPAWWPKRVTASTADHLTALLAAAGGAPHAYAAGWRDAAFIEYYYVEDNDKCVQNCTKPKPGYPKADTWCGDLTPGANKDCWALYGCDTNCYPTESIANNFIVLRSMEGSAFGNTMYAEFQTGNQDNEEIDFAKPDFYELFNSSSDPWMMDNLYKTTAKATLTAMHEKLRVFASCAGDACP